MLPKLFDQLFPISVLWNVTNEKTVVIERYGHPYFLALAKL